MPSELERFRNTLLANVRAFDFALSSDMTTRLGIYYSLLIRWNDRLHLVAPCSPEEFAMRHVLESFMLLEHLPQGATIADVGSGAGLPIIPCLIARPDLDATLIESSQKKAVFLREALNAVGRSASIVARRFEEIEAPPVSFVSCRALDQFVDKLDELVSWAPEGATLLLFGGEALGDKLRGKQEYLIPASEKRYLFVVGNKSGF